VAIKIFFKSRQLLPLWLDQKQHPLYPWNAWRLAQL